jgi:hypothetical protein
MDASVGTIQCLEEIVILLASSFFIHSASISKYLQCVQQSTQPDICFHIPDFERTSSLCDDQKHKMLLEKAASR